MEFNQLPDNSSDKVKNRRGLMYVAGLILLGLAILGISQCSDSSMYTLNPEKFNKIVFLPIFGVVVVGGLIAWFIVKKKRKDL